MKKAFAAALALSFALAAYADAVPAPKLPYVLSAADGVGLTLRLENAGGDPNGLDVLLDGSSYLGGGSYQSAAKRLVPSASGAANMDLGGFLRAAGAFSVHKTRQDYDQSGPVTVDDGTTASVKVRRGADVYLKAVSVQERGDLADGAGKEAAILKANVSLPFPESNSNVAPSAKPVYALRVNGSTAQLSQPDGLIAAGTYVVSGGDTVVFPVGNLSQRVNAVTLLVDGVPSNTFAYARRADWLTGVKRVEFKSEPDGPVMRAYLAKRSSLYDVSTLDVLADGSAVPKADAAAFGDELVVRLPLSRFSRTTKAVTLQVRDPATGLASDPYAANLEKYFRFEIPSVTLSYVGSGVVVRIPNDPGSLFAFGQAGELSVKFNDLEYGPQGVREATLDASGAALKDSSGIGLFHLVRQTPFVVGAGYVEFTLPASAFKDANVLVYRNGALGWDTPAFAFDRDGKATGTPAEAPKPEKASFVPADAVSKPFEFVNKDLPAVKLGALALDNLDSAAAYELSFTVYSDADFNPFSAFTYAGEPLITAVDAKGKAAYRFFRRAKGSELAAQGEFLWTPSGVRSQGPVALSLKEVVLKRLDAASQYATALSVDAAGTAVVKWTYDFGNCWDGGSQACEAAGYSDPALLVSSAAQAGASAVAVPAAAAVLAPAPAPVANEVAAASGSAAAPTLRIVAAPDEPTLTRLQKRDAFVIATKLGDAVDRIAKGDSARAKRLGDGLAAAIVQRLPTLADRARRALLRAVAGYVQVRYQP